MDAPETESDVGLSFRAVADGIEVFDPIERHTSALDTPTPVDPEPASTDGFPVPVDAAVSFSTSAVETANVVAAYVRDDAGTIVAEAGYDADASLPAGTYIVELTMAVKTYLRVEGPFEVRAPSDRISIEFDGETRVTLAARSRHERPAATVTTTDDPRDVMAALSTLGSALKTTSPERAYPTLRGHPPLVERGDELDIPDGIERPETGVRIELPPKRRYIYPAAPLAYYLGAELDPGDTPRIVTDDGFSYALDAPDYETAVARTLKQCFLLDCVVRTEGIYELELDERAAVEAATDIDPAALYDASLTARLEAYLGVDWATIADHVPTWKLTAHVGTDPEQVSMIPFLVDDLAVIRSPRERAAGAGGSATQRDAAETFIRGERFTRSADEADPTPETVVPADTDSLQSAWAGTGVPAGASKPSLTAFRNRLSREPADDDVGVTVICNDEAMDAERNVVESAYGARENLPISVSVHRNLTVEELRDVLAEPNDFLHYIGHIDDDGFACADGRLDAETIAELGVDAFLLNACRSYRQGSALVDAGAIGGVVTLADVVDEGAAAVGCTLARLLNRGFPLRAALDLAGDESVIGHQYAVLGDGGLSIAQAESGTPVLYDIAPEGDGTYTFGVETYPTSDRGLGSVFIPFLPDHDECYLSSGRIGEFSVTAAELESHLEKENAPVMVDDELRWAHDIDLPL